MIGKRPTMEDAFAIIGGYCDNDNWDFYAVFDGHAARFLSFFFFFFFATDRRTGFNEFLEPRLPSVRSIILVCLVKS